MQLGPELERKVSKREALRLCPCVSTNNRVRRNGSQKLVDRACFGSFGLEPLNSTPNPVVTSPALAGFASAFVFSLRERFSVLALIVLGSMYFSYSRLDIVHKV